MSTGTCVIIQDKFINPRGAVPIQVAKIPKLFPFEVADAWYTSAPCIVLNPDKKMPPNVRLIKPSNRLGENENIIIPTKNPVIPATKIETSCFWGDIFPIIKAPMRAPKPSEEANTPILNSDSINFSLPRTGINETKGNPKMLKIKVIISTNLKLAKL